jgi:hypothetical protein
LREGLGASRCQFARDEAAHHYVSATTFAVIFQETKAKLPTVPRSHGEDERAAVKKRINPESDGVARGQRRLVASVPLGMARAAIGRLRPPPEPQL